MKPDDKTSVSADGTPVATDTEQPGTTPSRQASVPPSQSDLQVSDLPDPSLDDETKPQPPKLKKSGGKWLAVVLVFVAVLLVAAAGWYFFLRTSSSPEPTPQATTQSDSGVSSTDDNDVPEAENTESFTSDPYRLTLQHPKTWIVTEEDDNSILVQSQDFSYKTVDGTTKKGNFRVYIRKGATTADSEIIATGVAIAPSEVLKYTDPTPSQRTETNLSNFGIKDTSNFGFLLITSNFSLKTGDVLGPNFGNETDAFIIGGGYSESGITPGMATNQVSATDYDQTNAYKQAIAIIESLQIN